MIEATINRLRERHGQRMSEHDDDVMDLIEVFEKADSLTVHEVTTDEREALKKAICYLRGAYRIRTPKKRDESIPGTIEVLERLVAGFRRSEVPGPSAKPNWDTRVQKLREAVAAQTGSYLSIEGAEAILETVSWKVQGGPSDATALIRDLRKLLNAHSLHGEVPADDIDALLDRHEERAALRAANSVPEGGAR